MLYNIQIHPLFNNDGLIERKFNTLKNAHEKLATLNKQPFNTLGMNQVATGIQLVADMLGYPLSIDEVKPLLNAQSFNTLVQELGGIIRNLNKRLNHQTYNPFGDFAQGGIEGNLRNFLKILLEKKEDVATDATYDNGKMYQSRIIPSWLSKTMDKFITLEGKEYNDFLEKEFGQYEWFRDTSMPITNKGSWINPWLSRLVGMKLEDRKKLFGHHVQLNYLGHSYMRNMSAPEYVMSVLTEFNSGTKDVTNISTAWYKIPMMSNKPSLEFIKFERFIGSSYREDIAKELVNVFAQELNRIITVTNRNYTSDNPKYIKNFDGERGKSFLFLDYLQDYLPGGSESDSELGKRLKAKLNDEEIEPYVDAEGKTHTEERALNAVAKEVIMENMHNKAKAIVEEYKSNGIFEACKTIDGVGKSDDDVEAFLHEFVWNDTFAAINILQLTITDLAYYANAEDVQKRLAQIHAPGLKGNLDARDYGEYDANGKKIRDAQRVCDGKLRTIFLEDYEGKDYS
jgi:hypothetical protein